MSLQGSSWVTLCSGQVVKNKTQWLTNPHNQRKYKCYKKVKKYQLIKFGGMTVLAIDDIFDTRASKVNCHLAHQKLLLAIICVSNSFPRWWQQEQTHLARCKAAWWRWRSLDTWTVVSAFRTALKCLSLVMEMLLLVGFDIYSFLTTCKS